MTPKYSQAILNVAWITVAGALTFLILGCDPGAEQKRAPETSATIPSPHDHQRLTEVELVAIARSHLEKDRPEWANVEHLQPRIVEHDHDWEVTWDLPSGTLGGTPVVHISKETLEVIRAYHTQ